MMQSFTPDVLQHEAVHRRSGIATRKVESVTVPVLQRTTLLRYVLCSARDAQEVRREI
jgi:hypothetical protein